MNPGNRLFPSLLAGLVTMLALALLLVPTSRAASHIHYVDATASGDGSGTSWTNAFTDLQAALDAARQDDQIWVAEGIYKPTRQSNAALPRSATFLLQSGIAIYGGFPSGGAAFDQRDWQRYPTTLSGDIGIEGDVTDNSYHVITDDGTSATAILDGFVITGGNANDTTLLQQRGGGLYNGTGNPTLRNLIFRANRAEQGGAIYNNGGNFRLSNVTFEQNYSGESGGAIYNYNSNATFVNTVFLSNTANLNGGGIYNQGSNPSLINVTFHDNHAGGTDAGGGMYSDATSNPTVTNSIFWGNHDSNGTTQSAQLTGPYNVTYSLIQAWQDGGIGNLNVDPHFVGQGDLRLQWNSSAIDAGNNNAVLDGTESDLDGESRFVDMPNVTDSGTGTPPIVDMGAYEASYPDLVMQMTAEPGNVLPGQPVTYTLTFSNTGTLAATGVVITGTIPSTVVVTEIPNPSVVITDTGATAGYVWEVSDLAPGVWGEINIVGYVDPEQQADSTLQSTATIDGTRTDLNPANGTDQADISLTVPRIQFGRPAASVQEDGLFVPVPVTLNNVNPYAETYVDFLTRNATALAGTDYTAISGTLTFPAGTLTTTIDVPIHDNDVADGDREFYLALDQPRRAMVVTPYTTALTILDDDLAAVEAMPVELSLVQGGVPGHYSLVLTSRPAADVLITLSAGNGLALSPTTLTFTPENWNVHREVTVTAPEDEARGRDYAVTLHHMATSEDPDYDGIAIADVTVNVGVLSGVSITPVQLALTAGGEAGNYSIMLDSQPAASVVITPLVEEGVEISPSSLTFTPDNWNNPQEVTLLAHENDGYHRDYSVVVRHTATSADPDYNSIAIPEVSVAVTVPAGIEVTPLDLYLTAGEAAATYVVTLTRQPMAVVTVQLAVDPELEAVPTSLTFTPENWDQPRVVTVTARDRSEPGTYTRAIRHTVTGDGGDYGTLSPPQVTVHVTVPESGEATTGDDPDPTFGVYLPAVRGIAP